MPYAPVVSRRSMVHGGLGFSLLFFGCTDSHPIVVTVSPKPLNVLTCSIVPFQATVTGSTNTAVTWSVSPATGGGAIDATGSYSSPSVAPSPPNATILASSVADSKATDTSDVTLATAFPGAATTIAGSSGITGSPGAGVYVHTVASQGMRVYAAWPDNPTGSSTVGLKVARSDDGGVTWQAAVTAISATLHNATTSDGGLECPAIAIDAGDPDVVYAVSHITTENNYSMPLDTSTSGAQTTMFAVSTDGGATWASQVLHVGSGGDICADVASPVADTVTVVSPGWSDCGRDMFVWSDNARGAAFATGTYSPNPIEYFADGYTGALDDLANDPACTAAHLWVESDGGTDAAGDTTESPRLFSDPIGDLCVVYVADVIPASGPTVTHSYIQCSADSAQTFSVPLMLDPSATVAPSSASGAAKATQGAGAIWTTGAPGGLYIATSANGQTFTAPTNVPVYTFPGQTAPAIALNPTMAYDFAGILWIAYHASDNGTGTAIIVDKSCDDGATWSGPVPVDGVGGATPDLKWPVLSLIPSFAPRVTAWDTDQMSTFTLAP